MVTKIVDKIARQTSPPSRGNKVIRDDTLVGLCLVITARGARSFALNYTVGGRERRITIGRYPTWSVAAAREEAKRLKRLVDQGIDPLAERENLHAAPTVTDLWREYQTAHMSSLAPRSRKDIRAMWKNDILPRIGSIKLLQLTSRDTDDIHLAVSADRPVRANRVLESLRAALNLAQRWGWIERNPANGFRRNPETPRERFLDEDELDRLYAALDQLPDPRAANAIRLIALTGARRGEVLNAKWDQFDLDKGLWIKPAAETKQRRSHRIPISTAALALLKAMKTTATSDYLFPTSRGTPMQDLKRSWLRVTKAAELPGVRLHDLRHTFASILASHGETLHVIGKLLGHSQQQTTMRYAHLLDDPLRRAVNHIR